MSYNRCKDTHKFGNKYLPSAYNSQVDFRSHFSGKKVHLIVREIRYLNFHFFVINHVLSCYGRLPTSYSVTDSHCWMPSAMSSITSLSDVRYLLFTPHYFCYCSSSTRTTDGGNIFIQTNCRFNMYIITSPTYFS